MRLMIRGKYLVIPVNTSVREKKILFRDRRGKAVFDFTAPLDVSHPKYYSYINVERFQGMAFEVEVTPEALFEYCFTDALPAEDPEGARRPFVHFTTCRGWLSDPNGLFWYGGKYHMFYQYNPCSTLWGNMHWGHAVSDDLMRWEECDPVLYPDQNGAAFTGSAFVDSENASGLRLHDDDPAPILLYYTAAEGVTEQPENRRFSQCMAFSVDGGRTFRKYAGNPIMEHLGGNNRDPKVTYVPELGKYVMALFMENNEYALFTSENLFRWKPFQTLTLPDDSECPDFYPLEGTDGERLWIFSGGQDHYTVGRMEAEGFVPIQSARPFHFGDRCSYAGQTFAFPNTVACGSLYPRRIRMTYDLMHMTDAPFENQMGIPTEMSIVQFGEIYRLRSWPVEEIRQLYCNSRERRDIRLGAGEAFVMPLDNSAYDVTIVSDFANGDFTVTVFGVTMSVCTQKNKLILNSASTLDNAMPLSYSRQGIDIRILIDTAGVEIFCDGGLIYSTAAVPSDFGMPYIRIETEEGAAISSVTANALTTVFGAKQRKKLNEEESKSR